MTKTFFANPFDSDWLNSIQAGRFFTYTDAARWDVGIRMGFLKASIKNKWVIISGGQKIIYKRPLKIFRFFQITFQLTGWDDKWIYAAHVFRQKGDVKCVAFTKIGFRARGSLVNPHKVFGSIGHHQKHIPPNWILNHFQNDLDTLKHCAEQLF